MKGHRGDRNQTCASGAERRPRVCEGHKGKETKLGNTVIDGPVREIFFFLKPADKTAQFRPGNIFRHLVKDIGKIIQINADVSRIRYDSMVRKAAQRDHLSELFEIIVHDGTSLVIKNG